MDALAHLPMAVVVVAAAAGGSRSCSTATATYVSVDPPLLVTPLSARSRTGELAQAAGEFSVSVLAADQAEVAVRAAAASTGDRFAEQGIDVLEAPVGSTAPAVAASSAAYWCDVEATYDVGERTLLVGRVRASVVAERLPLLRFEQRYRALGEAVEVVAEAAYPL
jgi:flavin reductase (DIM6/NTAB) family NADH-FMN oxidoreductase RutF